MASYYHALGIDYDGTIAYGAPPEREVLDALAGLRQAGLQVVLVTGRILRDVELVELASGFDALVGEDGAVLARPGQPARPLAAPVERGLARALEARGVPVHVGDVLLATPSRYLHEVEAEVERLGLRASLALHRNRESLMILPAGISKGTGVRAALAELGVAPERCVGLGDGENDAPLLAACGLGVAVADAIDALRASAQQIVPQAGPAGIAAFLRLLPDLRPNGA